MPSTLTSKYMLPQRLVVSFAMGGLSDAEKTKQECS